MKDTVNLPLVSIPDYQTLMLPLLRLAATRSNGEFSLHEAIEVLAEQFQLSPADRQQLLPSGRQPVFVNRVGWARTYLKKAGLIDVTRRGFFKLSERGQSVLHQNPSEVNVRFLRQFPEFIEFENFSSDRGVISKEPPPDSQTPEELLEIEHQKIRDSLATQILQTIKQCSPAFFEKLVVELLVKMGYGGSRLDAGRAVGRSNDGGIDGIIKEDKLGLEVIYIQAKRWDENTIGRREIQQFAGALQGQRANKGIFITTSRFAKQALEYVSHIGGKIVLIDGEQLAQLCIDNNVGVSVAATYEIKKIDSDYFTEAE